jgi:hypothetical protein
LRILSQTRLTSTALTLKRNILLLGRPLLVTEHRTMKSVIPINPVSIESTFRVWAPSAPYRYLHDDSNYAVLFWVTVSINC